MGKLEIMIDLLVISIVPERCIWFLEVGAGTLVSHVFCFMETN
jgi:hypothetical protein